MESTPNSNRVIKVDKINPYCGCGDKAWYVLYEGGNVLGADEFPYKTKQEFDTKLEELSKKYDAAIIING